MLKNRDSHIAVHAECEYDGVKDMAHVGISVRDAYGKSIDEIMELFDENFLSPFQCGNSFPSPKTNPVSHIKLLTIYATKSKIMQWVFCAQILFFEN